jgi:folate-binding protein YgfZ
MIVSTDTDRLDALREHLDKLLIMEDCELQEAPGLRRLRYWPGEAPPRSVPEHVTGIAEPLGFELLLPEAEAQSLLEVIRERPRPDLVEAWRIAIGVPKWGAELSEETTPIEGGIDRMLSFAKGCYVGQEVVAMATYRGRVAWNLVRLEADGAAPAGGARLGEGGKGRVTSATQVGKNAILLGYVHKELIVPGSSVALDEGRVARVLGLPYGSLPGAGVCA